MTHPGITRIVSCHYSAVKHNGYYFGGFNSLLATFLRGEVSFSTSAFQFNSLIMVVVVVVVGGGGVDKG